MVDQMLVAVGMSRAELNRDDRRPHIVQIRRKVATFLREAGWSLPRIGRFLERDHSTVMSLLGLRKRP